jgi:predicted RNA methylase
MGRSGTGFNNVPKKSNTIKSIKTGEEITDIIEYANKTPENKIEVKNNINKIVNDELVEIKKNDVIIGEKLDTTNILEKNKIINDIISPEKIETPKTEFKVGDVIIIDNKGTTAKITRKGFFNKADVEKGQYFVELQ